MASTDNLTHFLTNVADAIREKNGTSDPINAQNFADAIRIIPITEDTIADWGFTKNTGDYIKPTTGIPKSDLDSSVQASLEKADTALQSYTEQYKGTITGVSANGTSVATSGVANIPAASTSKYGVTKLTSSTSSTSTTLAATASAVKSAYDLANKKQDKLTSGTNIKTINGESILGSGNITISGGSGGSGEVFEVLPNDSQQYDLQPNHHYYIENPRTNGNFTFKLPTTEGATLRIMVRPKYSYVNTTISFITDSTGGDVFWANDIPPSFDGNSTIEMSFTGVTCGTSGINFAGI